MTNFYRDNEIEDIWLINSESRIFKRNLSEFNLNIWLHTLFYKITWLVNLKEMVRKKNIQWIKLKILCTVYESLILLTLSWRLRHSLNYISSTYARSHSVSFGLGFGRAKPRVCGFAVDAVGVLVCRLRFIDPRFLFRRRISAQLANPIANNSK